MKQDKDIQVYGYLRRCCVCGGYFDIDDMEQLPDGRWICKDCYRLVVNLALAKGYNYLMKKIEEATIDGGN